MNALAAAALALACAAGGVALLRRAWSLARRRAHRRAELLCGWALPAAGVLVWRARGEGWDKAAALATLAPAFAALTLLAAGNLRAPRAAPKAREVRSVEPPEGAGPLWRHIAVGLCVGPLAGAASVALGVAVALRGPGSDADRLVLAEFAAPFAWAAAAVWATTDPRLLRVAGGLSLLLGIGVAGAVL